VYLNGRSASVRQKIDQERNSNLLISSITRAELFYGASKSISPQITLKKQQEFLSCFPSVSFDDNAALFYGDIRASLERSGIVIGSHDMLIAAIAVSNDLTLISHNIKEFQRIPNLRIEDWQTDFIRNHPK
jgi:tRNA(fMet)-specific endonuclease VapC